MIPTLGRSASLLLSLLLAATAAAQDWGQWARSAQHDATITAVGRPAERIQGEFVIDANVDAEIAAGGGALFVHYPVPLVDNDDLFVLEKGGTFTSRATPNSQTWSVKNIRKVNGQWVTQWKVLTDWKVVPLSSGTQDGPRWEPVYQPAMTAAFVYTPAAGGTMLKLDRLTGAEIARYNPFGSTLNANIFTAGPPSIDAAGNVYYNAIQYDPTTPYTTDIVDSWLVKIAANGTMSKVSYRTLTPNAPKGTDQCTGNFTGAANTNPPSPTAVPPSITCGSQRPGINVAPAIAADGTIYSVSRAHFTGRWSYLVAANANLTPKWASSLRNRFTDACGVLINCKPGTTVGVDPADNELPSGRVTDDSTATPAVAPDGSIYYGSYTSYNFGQGHLVGFKSDGSFLASYPWGWDFTPSIWPHNGTYSLIMKENHYAEGAYYLIQLTPTLQVEWKYKNTETRSCSRWPDGTINCFDDHPGGFEWCVNAVAVDANGTAYANSEDGNLYAIGQGGVVRQKLFLRLALGAAYTPLSIGRDGTIYTQNDGKLYIVGESGIKRRPARKN